MRNDGFSYDGNRVLTCDALVETGLVRHGFSTRCGGESFGRFSSLNLGVFTQDERETVLKNFALFCCDVGVNHERLTFAKQVHSTRVKTVTAEDAGRLPEDCCECDGLVTNEPGVCLTCFTADCTPLLILDPVKRVVASVHSGWRGTLGQIAGEAVAVMQTHYGSAPETLIVAMGPSLKQCHFAVDEDVFLLFVERFGELAEQCTLIKQGKYYIDTDRLNVHTLMKAGVLKENIHISSSCTFCEEALFFSYRRDGETGRMCAVIELI